MTSAMTTLMATLVIIAAVSPHQARGHTSSLALVSKPSPWVYAPDETITVSYVDSKLTENSIVAIFPVTSTAGGAPASTSFVRTAAAADKVVFSASTASGTWPLAPGSYYLVLLDAAGQPQTERCPFTVSSGASGATLGDPKAPPASLSLLTPVHALSGAPLIFNFVNPVAAPGDLIGIWTTGSWAWAAAWPASSKATSTTWVRLCGTCSCTDAVPSGQVTFSVAVSGIVWPLAAGEYVAVVVDGQGNPKSPPSTFAVSSLTVATAAALPRVTVARRLLAL